MKIYFLIFILLYSYTTGQTSNRRAPNSNPQYSQNPPINQRSNSQQPNTYYTNANNKPPARPRNSYPPAGQSQNNQYRPAGNSQNNQYRPTGSDQSNQNSQNVPRRDQSSPIRTNTPTKDQSNQISQTKKNIPKYICSVQYDGNEECSCVITGTKTVVTAAHCVYEKNSKYYQVAVGSDFNITYDVVDTNYKNFVYQYPYFDDIVELTLSNSIETSETEIVQTPSREECTTSLYGNQASIWGPTDKNSPSILDEIKVKILKPSDLGCSTYYGSKRLSPKMFCAGWDDGKIDPCKGNDGSPLIYNNKLYGIASWGKGCKRPTQASVYADFCKFTHNYTDPEEEEFVDYMNEWENYDDPVENY